MHDNFVRRFAVSRIVSGDTVEGTIDLGFGVNSGVVEIHLSGVDAPSSHQQGFAESTAFLTSLIERGHLHLFVTEPDGVDVAYYGELRVVDAKTQESININQEMLDSGHAVPLMV